jgi:hypothetical protein
VGDEDNRLVQLVMQFDQKVLHAGTNQSVEGRERLVHEKNFWIRAQSASEAKGQFMSAMITLGASCLGPTGRKDSDDQRYGWQSIYH